MSPVARWSIALCSGAAAVVCTAFSAGYSHIEHSIWRTLDSHLPVAVQAYSRVTPFAVGLGMVILLLNIFAADRRSDTVVVVISSIAWLFGISWALACLFLWRVPYGLGGGPVID